MPYGKPVLSDTKTVYFEKVTIKVGTLTVSSSQIIESLDLEWIFKGHLVQLPCNEQGHLHLSRVSQRLVRPSLENLQGQVIHHVSGQPVSMPRYP